MRRAHKGFDCLGRASKDAPITPVESLGAHGTKGFWLLGSDEKNVSNSIPKIQSHVYTTLVVSQFVTACICLLVSRKRD